MRLNSISSSPVAIRVLSLVRDEAMPSVSTPENLALCSETCGCTKHVLKSILASNLTTFQRLIAIRREEGKRCLGIETSWRKGRDCDAVGSVEDSADP